MREIFEANGWELVSTGGGGVAFVREELTEDTDEVLSRLWITDNSGMGVRLTPEDWAFERTGGEGGEVRDYAFSSSSNWRSSFIPEEVRFILNEVFNNKREG